MLESNPELLNGDVEARLDVHSTTMRERGMEETARFIDGHRQFLSLCRQIGVDQAFARTMRHNPDGLGIRFLRIMAGMKAIGEVAEAATWRESLSEVLIAHPEVLSDEAHRVLEEAIRSIDDEHAYRLRTLQMLLVRCCNVGVDHAFAEVKAAHSEELADAAAAFLSAESDDAARAVIDGRPELLSYPALFLLSERIADAAGAGETRLLVPFLEEQQSLLEQYLHTKRSGS